MLVPGLVSVTFRGKSRSEIAVIMKKAELHGIEWGGDVHVPEKYDELEEYEGILIDAVRLSSGPDFCTVSYGSYYRCETGDENSAHTAVSIGAPNIRVWAGSRGSAEADSFYRNVIIGNIQRLCDYVRPYGMTVSTEFHGGTLTDEYTSAVRLINEVERDNFYTYWQPNQFRDEEYNISALRAVLPYLSNVHVFTWEKNLKFPLAHGEAKWRRYIDIISSDGHDHNMLLEFVCDDTESQLYRDSETLRSWIM